MSKTEIIAKDGNSYYYTTSLFNVENPLGVIKATLTEYSLYRMNDGEILIGKLYKTDEGNWYDLPDNNPINPLLLTFIKMAIDEAEKTKPVVNAG
jgi:hypothetical protein